MHEERINKLIDALESGEYNQCFGRMKTHTSFCVLGVACDIYTQENEGRWVITSYGNYANPNEAISFKLDGNPTLYHIYPPDEVLEWYGIDEEIASILTKKNDSKVSFAYLAAILKALQFNQA